MDKLVLSLVSDNGQLSQIYQDLTRRKEEEILASQQKELIQSQQRVIQELHYRLEDLLCKGDRALANRDDIKTDNGLLTVLSYDLNSENFESSYMVEIDSASRTVSLNVDFISYSLDLIDFGDKNPKDRIEECQSLKTESIQLRDDVYQVDRLVFNFAAEIGFRYKTQIPYYPKDHPCLPGLEPTESTKPVNPEVLQSGELVIDYFSGKGLGQLEEFVSLLEKFKPLEEKLRDLPNSDFSEFKTKFTSFKCIELSATLDHQLIDKPVPYRLIIDHSNGISVEIENSTIKVDIPDSLEEIEALQEDLEAIKKNNLDLDQLLAAYAQENQLTYHSPFSYQK